MVQQGLCSSSVAGSGNVSVPFLAMDNATSERFEASSVDFTRTSCTKGFQGIVSSTEKENASWREGMCLGAATQVCLKTNTTELVRIVMRFSGTLTMSAALHVDGRPVAWAGELGWHERGISSTHDAVDALVLLNSGACRQLQVVYHDGVSIGAGLDADHEEKVRMMAFRAPHF